MKKFRYIILASLTAAAVSCADLDTQLTTGLGTSNMWTTADQAESGVAGIYRTFYSSGAWEFDNTPAIGRNRAEVCGFTSMTAAMTLYFHTETPSPARTFFSLEWKALYEGIHDANTAIANLENAPLTEEREHQLMCEAKFLRAFFYTRLNMLFQGVPLYLEPVNNQDCTKGRSSVDEVWDAVLSDLDDCINDKYMPDNTLTGSYYGRPSKGAAYALRGLVYLWKKNYSQASTDLAKVEQCGYGLYQGEYADIFTEANEKNCEMVFPLQFTRTSGYSDQSQLWFGSRSSLGSVNRLMPSTEFVDSFENADGSEFDWEQIFPDWNKLSTAQRAVFFVRDGMDTNTNTNFVAAKKNLINTVSQEVWDKYYLNEGNEARIGAAYTCRDPRLMDIICAPSSQLVTCNWTGSALANRIVRWPYLIDGSGTTQDSDYWPDYRTTYHYSYKKFNICDDATVSRNLVGRDWPLIRFTDVLLEYAEAENELGNLDAAIEAVNRVRSRAHMPALTNGGSGANAVKGKDDMLKRIQYESRVELCGEGVNLFHEARWGTWKQSKFQGKDIYGVTTVWGELKGSTWYYHDYLWPWPVPSTEVQKNPNIEPTEGYTY